MSGGDRTGGGALTFVIDEGVVTDGEQRGTGLKVGMGGKETRWEM